MKASENRTIGAALILGAKRKAFQCLNQVFDNGTNRPECEDANV